ncbi:MAG: FeoC-like transcriptional regulator [Chloroflexota bacterium]
MSTTLRQVLEQFEQRQGAVSLPQMARSLGIERGMLQNMIEYWVRKGKLREVGTPVCTTCGSASGCPFIVVLPRCYELASADSASIPAPMPYVCGSGKDGSCCH